MLPIVEPEVLMDGAPLTGIEQNGGVTDVKYTPTVDVIEEFKIQTNFFSAEFGNSGGTVINVVSKSGTNSYHGSVYDYAMNEALNAHQPYTGNRNVVKQHDWGYTIGGPWVDIVGSSVSTDLSRFAAINPCGLHAAVMGSVSSVLGREVAVADVSARVVAHMAAIFGRRLP